MKLILQALLLISLLPLSQAYGGLSSGAAIDAAMEQSKTKEEYAKWMSKGMEQELKKAGYSKEDLRVKIKVTGSLMTLTYSGTLIKDKGFRSQLIESHKGESESVSDAKLYSLGIRVNSIYLDDGTLLASGTIRK